MVVKTEHRREVSTDSSVASRARPSGVIWHSRSITPGADSCEVVGAVMAWMAGTQATLELPAWTRPGRSDIRHSCSWWAASLRTTLHDVVDMEASFAVRSASPASRNWKGEEDGEELR